MGKTFRRDGKFRPRKHGRVFTKEKDKKHLKSAPLPPTPHGPQNDWGIEGCDDFEKEG